MAGSVSAKEEKISKCLPTSILAGDSLHGKKLQIKPSRICDCKPTNINCMTAKEWLKSQIGVWQFFYEKRDIRNKKVHPATFPISLAKKVIELTNSKSEMVFKELPLDDPIKRKPDIELAKSLFGWQPEINLEKGLIETIDYFKKTLKL